NMLDTRHLNRRSSRGLVRPGRLFVHRPLSLCTTFSQTRFTALASLCQRTRLRRLLHLDRHTDMSLRSLHGQFDLPLPFSKPLLLFFGVLIVTMRATDPLDEMDGGFVICTQ